MKLKLQNRLIISYFALALLIIGLISFLVNFGVKRGFENYIIEEHNRLVTDVIINVEHSYNFDNNLEKDNYDIEHLEHIGVDAIEKGLIITIKDTDGHVIWSAMEHNAGLCEAMITNVKENMFDHYSNWDGNYTEDQYSLKHSDSNIGTLTVGYLGPFYFNEEELYFLSTINQVLMIVGLVSLFVAVIIGILISRSVTKPIKSVINHLNNIHDQSAISQLTDIHNTVEVTELYQAAITLEQRINEQEQLRKQLTQDMAHELKTPLTTIQGQLEAMIDGIFETSPERLESVYEEIIRIKSLITEIETLSVIENQNTSLSNDSFDLVVMLESVTSEFEIELKTKDMSIEILKTSDSHVKNSHIITGDTDKLKQAFINLISNAIKYSGNNSSIKISINQDEDYYQILFEDNGIGIPEKDKPYIFERFYRADPSRTGHNGLGIGLTLVKSIITKHNGSIELDENFTTGTRFIINLPVFH